MVTLNKSLVRSHLEYCCTLWSPRKITDTQLIESRDRLPQHAQEYGAFSTLITGGVLRLRERREHFIIIHTWELLQGLCPNDINVIFSAPSLLGIRAQVPRYIKIKFPAHYMIFPLL